MPAEYLISLGSVEQIPTLIKGNMLNGKTIPRIAMLGRSNVGKSSLINALVGSKIANVSKQPGHTRKINFFEWTGKKKMIADLPGYGFAARSAKEQKQWAEMIQAYLAADPMLKCALVLLDARRGPTQKDIQAIKMMQELDLPIKFVFTKADALKNQKMRSQRTKEAKKAMTDLGYDFANIPWVSSANGDNIGQLRNFLYNLED